MKSIFYVEERLFYEHNLYLSENENIYIKNAHNALGIYLYIWLFLLANYFTRSLTSFQISTCMIDMKYIVTVE